MCIIILFAFQSKMEKNGNDETVPDENDCAPRSHSHGSTSGSGSFSGSGERRRLKRRREEEEEDEDNAEDDRAHEEDRNRETERRRMDTIWIRGKNKLEEDDDEEEEVDDDDDEEGGVGEGGSDPGVIQKEILMQKPLGLLAQHGLSSRTPSSAKFHRKNSHDDEGLEEDEEEKRRSGGMREEEEEEDVRNGRTEDLEAGGEVNRPEKSFFLKSPSGGTGGHRRLYSSNQSDGDEEQVAAENVLSSRGCHDIGNFASHISLMDQRFMPSPPLSASPESGQDPSTPGGHHWTFEEQFKQVGRIHINIVVVITLIIIIIVVIIIIIR